MSDLSTRSSVATSPTVIGFTQIYNEVKTGHLERFLKYFLPQVDEIWAYDDGSTDGSYEELVKAGVRVIRSDVNDFQNELAHKSQLLDTVLRERPNARWIFWLDIDEVVSTGPVPYHHVIRDLALRCEARNRKAVGLKEINLYRSRTHKRVDNLYDHGKYVRLWRVSPGLKFTPKAGLHQQQYPANISPSDVWWVDNVQVLHYGFSSDQLLADKYQTYRAHGQSGWALDRIIKEDGFDLRSPNGYGADIIARYPYIPQRDYGVYQLGYCLGTERVAKSMFPEGLWIDDEQNPKRRAFAEAMKTV